MGNAEFEFQKWPVYKKSLNVVTQAYKICGELPRESTVGIRDQLRRASHSIPLNIAEGSARYTGKDKANFFRIARGSVFECVAIVDVIERLQFADSGFDEMLKDLASIGKMLSGLINFVESEKYKKHQSGYAAS